MRNKRNYARITRQLRNPPMKLPIIELEITLHHPPPADSVSVSKSFGTIVDVTRIYYHSYSIEHTPLVTAHRDPPSQTSKLTLRPLSCSAPVESNICIPCGGYLYFRVSHRVKRHRFACVRPPPAFPSDIFEGRKHLLAQFLSRQRSIKYFAPILHSSAKTPHISGGKFSIKFPVTPTLCFTFYMLVDEDRGQRGG